MTTQTVAAQTTNNTLTNALKHNLQEHVLGNICGQHRHGCVYNAKAVCINGPGAGIIDPSLPLDPIDIANIKACILSYNYGFKSGFGNGTDLIKTLPGGGNQP